MDLADEFWVDVDDKSFKQIVGELLIKIDEVPPSLVVAQAINESGWGRSRFAQEANNLFGMWCYTPGCGLVPERRRANDKHEVKRYASIQDSVNEYLRNINRNKAYRELRALRAGQRQRLQPLSVSIWRRVYVAIHRLVLNMSIAFGVSSVHVNSIV